METVPQRWANQARYDLETARSMLSTGRLLYVVFCCQQAVEKMLKAVIVAKTQQHPPRTHHLARLAEVVSLQASEETADFLRELSAYYIQSRYPDQIEEAAGRVSDELARDVLSRSEKVVSWLSSMI